MRFLDPGWLIALAAVGGLGVAVARAIARRRAALASVAPPGGTTIRRNIARHAIRASLVLIAVSLGVVALARPVWEPSTTTSSSRGADVVIAIDVSLSMLARDTSPSRLERAKLVIRDLADRLEGDRIGLIGFAGSSGILSPLTLDTEAASMFADQLEVQAVDEPGTALSRAVERSVEMFDAAGQGDRVLVVLSDGEDQSSDPVAVAKSAAALAHDNRIRVVAVALGTDIGSTIPLESPGGGAVKRDATGAPVLTRARRDVLRQLAADGLFVDAANADESKTIADYVGDSVTLAEGAEATNQMPDRYQTVVLAALVLLLMEYGWSAVRP